MTARARRLLLAVALLVLLLFLGRWLVTLLADRWWAGALSPAALATITHWHVLGLMLDGGAVAIAATWFAVQALLVARAIGSVQVERRIGELRVREAIPIRLLLLGAVGTGLLLGILTGVGAGAWRAPVMLAAADLRYGITDPLLGVDLGILIGEYPVWRLAHQFAALLAIVGLGFTLLLYLGIGAIRRLDGRLEIHHDARRHLGGLLAVLATVITVGYLLAPYRLATAIDVPLGTAAAATRVLATYAVAGAAVAVAIISINWAIRARHSLLTASWSVLALAVLAERVLIPLFVAEGAELGDRAEVTRQFEAVLYGLHPTESAPGPDSLPRVTTLWDEAALAAWSTARGGELRGATPVGAAGDASWLVATTFPGDSPLLEVARVAAGVVTPAGMPVVIDDRDQQQALVRDPRVVPGSPDWQVVEGRPGVPVGGLLRRSALAWARQAPGILTVPPTAAIDWELDPRDRVARLMPALTWHVTGLVEHQGRPGWLVSGMATVGRAPLVSRIAWAGHEVAGVVPAVVAVVRADDGSVELYVDPAADSLGHAWARSAPGLVQAADRIPAWLRTVLGYPADWLAAQLLVLQQPQWGSGTRPTDSTDTAVAAPAATWGADGPLLQAVLEDPVRGVPATIVEAQRRDGQFQLVLIRLARLDVPSDAERARAWRLLAGLGQLRDSLRASGDTMLGGPLRHHRGPAGVVTWQAFRSAGRSGDPAVLWIATARGATAGGGRDPTAAWHSLAGAGESESTVGPMDLRRRLDAIRGWVSRADSAMARGDLTAFARAWEAVRGLMLDAPRE